MALILARFGGASLAVCGMAHLCRASLQRPVDSVLPCMVLLAHLSAAAAAHPAGADWPWSRERRFYFCRKRSKEMDPLFHSYYYYFFFGGGAVYFLVSSFQIS